MSSLDFDRITHPLRLAKGSHQPGSGKGCAMNLISYINGDTEISDYPRCSAMPLARMVQMVNDVLAGPDGLLSPENSVLVLDLGWRTVGTRGAGMPVEREWMAELLIHPEHGVVKYALDDSSKLLIRRAASLSMRRAEGEYIADWIPREMADSLHTMRHTHAHEPGGVAHSWAVQAAEEICLGAATVAAGCALNAYYFSDASDVREMIIFTRWAIERWRTLAGIKDEPELTPAAVDSALERIGA